MVNLIEFDLDIHKSDLFDLNVEYTTWIFEKLRVALNIDLRESMDVTVEEYVAIFLKDFLKIKPPHGIILLFEDNRNIVGMGAVYELLPSVGEIKRMFIQPKYQGRGLGTKMLEKLISKGKEFGFGKLRLQTGVHFPYAIQLYSSAGFIEVEPDDLGEAPAGTNPTQMELVF